MFANWKCADIAEVAGSAFVNAVCHPPSQRRIAELPELFIRLTRFCSFFSV